MNLNVNVLVFGFEQMSESIALTSIQSLFEFIAFYLSY